MARLPVVDPDTATGESKQLFARVKSALGVIPNMTKVMANSPALLDGYLALAGALTNGKLDAGTRELIAITVAEVNGCEYCLSAHTYIGANVAKLDASLDARQLAHRRRFLPTESGLFEFREPLSAREGV